MSNLESLNRHVADIRVKTKWGLSLSGPLRFFRKFASGVGRVANLRRGCLPRLPQDRVKPWLVDQIFIGGDGAAPLMAVSIPRRSAAALPVPERQAAIDFGC